MSRKLVYGKIGFHFNLAFNGTNLKARDCVKIGDIQRNSEKRKVCQGQVECEWKSFKTSLWGRVCVRF